MSHAKTVPMRPESFFFLAIFPDHLHRTAGTAGIFSVALWHTQRIKKKKKRNLFGVIRSKGTGPCIYESEIVTMCFTNFHQQTGRLQPSARPSCGEFTAIRENRISEEKHVPISAKFN